MDLDKVVIVVHLYQLLVRGDEFFYTCRQNVVITPGELKALDQNHVCRPRALVLWSRLQRFWGRQHFFSWLVA